MRKISKLTHRQLHEQAAGYGLDNRYFAQLNLNPDGEVYIDEAGNFITDEDITEDIEVAKQIIRLEGHSVKELTAEGLRHIEEIKRRIKDR